MNVPTLLTHAVQTTDDELSLIAEGKHTVIHCPISNRLLGNGVLDLDSLAAHDIRFVCGTDGLSSNYSLDLFEEMKIALFIHPHNDLLTLAHTLWQGVTKYAAEALRLNCGKIMSDYDADFLVLKVDYPINEQLPIHLINQPRNIQSLYIQGEKIK